MGTGGGPFIGLPQPSSLPLLPFRGNGMIFVLILHGVLGPAVAGTYEDAESCQKAALAYVEALKAGGRKIPQRMGCVGFAKPEPAPTEWREA